MRPDAPKAFPRALAVVAPLNSVEKNDDTAEPLLLGTVVPATDDTAEPSEL